MKIILPRLLEKYLLPLAAPKFLLLMALPVAVMAGIVLPGAEADLKSLGNGLGPLDLLFHYAPSTAWRYLDAYGSQGRSLYLFCELSADVAYPLFYTLFFLTLTLWLLKKSGRPTNGLAWLLPLLPGMFDFLENGMLVWLLLVYPQKWWLPAFLAGLFTTAKWVALAVLLAFACFLALRAGRGRRVSTR